MMGTLSDYFDLRRELRLALADFFFVLRVFFALRPTDPSIMRHSPSKELMFWRIPFGYVRIEECTQSLGPVL